MTSRTYWCVLSVADTKRWSGKPYFAEVEDGGFSYDLDLDGERGTQLRDAMLTGIGHTGGDASAIGAYRMDVYDGDGNVRVSSYCASPPGGYAPPGSLAEYADDQLIGELARRLYGR